MKGAYSRYSEDERLVVIGLGFQDSEDKIDKYAEKHTMPWPVGFDEDEVIAGLYGIVYGAGAVFIDRAGVVRGIFLGAFDEKMLADELEKIL